MSRSRALLTLGAVGLLCGGCVAAAIPVVAGAAIGGNELKKRSAARKPADKPVADRDAPRQGDAAPQLATQRARDLMRSAEGARPLAEGVPTPARPAVAGGSPVPKGNGEAAAYSLQAYQSLWAYVNGQIAARRSGSAPKSVVLAAGARLDAPRYVPCGDKPLAILFDLDETEPGSDPNARWRRWRGDGTDEVAAVPGAVEGIEAVRREQVQPIFTSARDRSGAESAAQLLDRLGLGPVVPDKTLFLRGGTPELSGDQIRQTIAASYCVIAIVGDSLSDFSDTFDAGDAARRPAAATETMVAPLWGAGWFLLPNPVRSTATPTTELPKE